MASNEQLYFGGDIYTIDDANPSAEAIAVKNGRIAAAGNKAYCLSRLGKSPELIDLKGSALLPGFIDAHTHPTLMIFYNMNTDLGGVTSIKDLQDRLKQASEKETSSNWILGLQFDEQSMDKPVLPDRHDLDTACPDRPAIIVKRDGHMVIANTRAIEEAGGSDKTGDPKGGKIDREPDGFPMGRFRESAMKIILKAMPLPELDTITESAAEVFKKIASFGITSIGMVIQSDEEGVAGSQGAFDVPMMELVLDSIPVSLYGILAAKDISPFDTIRKSNLHHEEIGKGHRIGAFKIWGDGTFGSRTSFLSRPFTDQPDKSGFMVLPEDEIYRRMEIAHKTGLQIAIHTIGDASTRICLDLFDRLLAKFPNPDHRHRLEHASLLTPDLINDIARLNLVVSTQPMFIHSEKDWLVDILGPERLKWAYPLKSLVDAGVKVACSSDAPIESMDILHAIQCCVTREGFEPQESVTPEKAVRMFTIDAAYSQFEESVKGSLTPGKRADMVILSHNPVSVPAKEIKNIRVESTICGGKIIA